MCLITLNWQPASKLSLIVVANRDEFYARPTLSLDYWSDQPILAGKDLAAGGTWLGLGKASGKVRLAALTNYRDINNQKAYAPTRGHITSAFLNGAMSAAAYLDMLAPTACQYNPFNLVLFDGQHLMGFESRHQRIFALPQGLTSVSNADFNTPWPKLTHLHQGVACVLASDEAPTDERFFQLLSHSSPAADAELPQTGIPIERERALSSAFIHTPNYGTRASSIIRVHDGTAEFTERQFDADGFKAEVKKTLAWGIA